VSAVHGGELTRTREIFHKVFRRPVWRFECGQFSSQFSSIMVQGDGFAVFAMTAYVIANRDKMA
jgi:hypothetical protein